LVIYLFGVSWYGVLKAAYFAEEVKAYTLFVSLFLVFLPGDILKNLVAAFVAKRMSSILPKIMKW
ncbi:MAG: biotin transporter BioY, partial [Clostridia bacterium]|nr:biotin transporter BioY [Clostridia bacterium]